MLKNRSVPADTILPHLVYEDVAGALTWLAKAFGFTEHFRYGQPGGPSKARRCIWAMPGSCSRVHGRTVQVLHGSGTKPSR